MPLLIQSSIICLLEDILPAVENAALLLNRFPAMKSMGVITLSAVPVHKISKVPFIPSSRISSLKRVILDQDL